MSRNEMLDALRGGICLVEFEKKDGTIREMKCTLNQNIIPIAKMPKEGVAYSESTIRVYEPVIDEWRSFRVDSVKKFERIA
jgi:hypothetical protein